MLLRSCSAAFSLFLAYLLGATCARAETVVIAGDIWCPINCAQDAREHGIFVELAEQIFAEAGIAVEYREVNWARAVHDTRSGKLDAVIGAGVHDAPDFLFGDTASGVSRSCFYARPGGAWRYNGIRSLPAVAVGAINGYSYGEELDSYIRAFQHDPRRVQLVAGDQALMINVEKVGLGRIGATLENTWVMEAYLTRAGKAATLEQVGCRRPDVPIYLAFSPALQSSGRYLAIYQQGLRRFRQDGRYEQLLHRYGVSLPE